MLLNVLLIIMFKLFRTSRVLLNIGLPINHFKNRVSVCLTI